MRLREQGESISGISRILRISRMRARRFLNAGSFPERAPRIVGTIRRSVASYEAYLSQRLAEGIRVAKQLYQEIRERGFRGSYRTVRRWARAHGRPHAGAASSIAVPLEWRSPRAVTWLLIKRSDELSEQDQRFVQILLGCDTDIAAARDSARDFVRIIRNCDYQKLDAWIKAAESTKLCGFVDGIKQDRQAVEAALRLPWSNGRVEGHVNRLKTIKRQMYGRAKFNLLRKRVLHAA